VKPLARSQPGVSVGSAAITAAYVQFQISMGRGRKTPVRERTLQELREGNGKNKEPRPNVLDGSDRLSAYRAIAAGGDRRHGIAVLE